VGRQTAGALDRKGNFNLSARLRSFAWRARPAPGVIGPQARNSAASPLCRTPCRIRLATRFMIWAAVRKRCTKRSNLSVELISRSNLHRNQLWQFDISGQINEFFVVEFDLTQTCRANPKVPVFKGSNGSANPPWQPSDAAPTR